MCSKSCHLVNAPLITQVKTTALGALDPPLAAWFFLDAKPLQLSCFIIIHFLHLRREHRTHLLGPQRSDVTLSGVHLGIRGHLNMTQCSGISLEAARRRLENRSTREKSTRARIAKSLILNFPRMCIFMSLTRRSRFSASGTPSYTLFQLECM